MRILIIDNDIVLTNMLSKNLKEFGYQSDIVETMKDGMCYLDIRNYDIVIIDWILFDGNIIDIIRSIKSKHKKAIVLVISSIDDDESEIEALRNGADDYIKKPFNLDVLSARIEARLGFDRNDVIKIDNLTIDPVVEQITYNENNIRLSSKTLEVLIYLIANRDQIILKEQLLYALWEEPELVTPNVIDVAINQIRQEIDKPFGITTIETVRRRGYRFCYPNEVE